MRIVVAAALACAALATTAPPAPLSSHDTAGIPVPVLTCKACLLVDDHGNELYALRAGERLANASTTKMVTALLVVAELDLDDRVEVSRYAASFGLGGLDLSPGESYTVRDLLYALLLTSSNDAAVALAEEVSGSESAFVEEMNEYATELGASDTRFVTPHGLDRAGHYSSARDLARIALAVLRRPALARIVRSDRAVLEGGVIAENRNLLLDSYKGAIGVKTGFTNDAGNVLVAAARRQGRRLVAVVMDSEDSFVDSGRLLDYGFAVLAQGVVLAAGTPVAAMVYDPAGTIAALAAEDVVALPDPADIELVFEPSHPGLPIVAGERVGVVLVLFRGRAIATTDAVASGSASVASRGIVERLLEGVLGAAARVVGRA